MLVEECTRSDQVGVERIAVVELRQISSNAQSRPMIVVWPVYCILNEYKIDTLKMQLGRKVGSSSHAARIFSRL